VRLRRRERDTPHRALCARWWAGGGCRLGYWGFALSTQGRRANSSRSKPNSPSSKFVIRTIPSLTISKMVHLVELASHLECREMRVPEGVHIVDAAPYESDLTRPLRFNKISETVCEASETYRLDMPWSDNCGVCNRSVGGKRQKNINWRTSFQFPLDTNNSRIRRGLSKNLVRFNTRFQTDETFRLLTRMRRVLRRFVMCIVQGKSPQVPAFQLSKNLLRPLRPTGSRAAARPASVSAFWGGA
jgi:hypothetical protein